MRIIAGRWAGRQLTSPAKRVRPTAEPVRDKLLTLLQPRLDGASVLDLFAGSGALGLEALSRGARRCDFVELNAAAMHSLKANVAALRARDRCRIFNRDASVFTQALPTEAYDLAFADPPYTSRLAERIAALWLETRFARTLCIEHPAERQLPKPGRRLHFEDTVVTIYG
jgi:16S rRNA (guanine966-N2)-methyltransferase